MADRIAAGLRRRSLTTCSRWACACRVMGKPFPGPWTFRRHPWLKDMHDVESEFCVGQKGAQLGFTEWALNQTFFHMDVKGVDCLYVLPAKTPDASDFSTGRFDPALELSPHLTKFFSDVKNIGHKRAGSTNLYIRGSRSRAGLKSIPVGLIVLDEVDEMDQDNIPLALERVGGQMERMILTLSTPTTPRIGINKLYLDSTQEHFFFKCPCCSRLTELTFPQCIEITAEDVNDPRLVESYLKCKECGGRLPHESKPDWLSTGRWVSEHADRAVRGFHVNQLYSSTVAGRPESIALGYLRSLRDPTEEQEFYNSKLGMAHMVEGASVTDADLDKCIRGHRMGSSQDYAVTTMGIDVGRWLHYEVCEWRVPGDVDSADLNVQSRPKLVYANKVMHFEELDKVVRDYRVQAVVIDANPERRKAYEFAQRHFGRVRMCFYGFGIHGKQIHIGKDEEPTITVDRTSWLDLALGRFRNQTIELPIDIPQEYRSHMKSLVRVYEKDRNGNPVGKYMKESSQDDHYAHARNYCELALPFALSMAQSYDIEEGVL